MEKKVFFTRYTEQSIKLPFVLAAVGLHHRQEYINRPSGLPYFQWIQSVKGKGVLELDDKQYVVEEGNGILFFPDEGHKYYGVSEEWQVHFLLFSGYGVMDYFEKIGIKRTSLYKLNNMAQVEKYLHELYLVHTQENPTDVFEYSRILYDIMLEFPKSSTIQTEKSIQNQNKKIHFVMDFINQHYMDPLVLSELAEKVQLSKEYLCLLFKKVNGFSIFEYITDVRLANARTLLIQDRKVKIKDISKLCGYEDVSYFGMVFKKKIGMTPTTFRELH